MAGDGIARGIDYNTVIFQTKGIIANLDEELLEYAQVAVCYLYGRLQECYLKIYYFQVCV